MINLMIVDDEIITVSIIRTQFNWKELGIDHVYTANSYQQACVLCQKHEIHIMICDIEMPQKSGLDLLEWIRSNNMKIVSVFLTGYDSFEYCSRAMELGGLEYVLKPAKFSVLEKAIRHAVQKVQERIKEERYIHYGENWVSNATAIQSLFWTNVINESITPNQKAIQSAADRYGLSLPENGRYALIWVRNWFDPSKSRGWDKSSLQYAISQIISELVGETMICTVTLPEQSASAFIAQKSPSLDIETLQERCTDLILHCDQYLSLKIDVLIGSFVPAEELSDQMSRLLQMCRDTVNLPGKVLPLERCKIKSVLSPIPKEKWKSYLSFGQFSLLHGDVNAYLQQQLFEKPDGISASSLFRLIQEFLSLIRSYLEAKSIPTQWLTEEKDEFYCCAFHSFQACETYMEWVISQIPLHLQDVMAQSDIVEKAKRFICFHIREDLSRDQIAQEVGVNAEYLSRLFKKREEKSMIEYIQEKKIAVAAELLQTDQSVSDIAVSIGYHNFAYFTQLFKKYTGQTPSAFKKQLLQPSEQ